MKNKDQIYIKTLVRVRQDYQALRKAIHNRLGVKADGSDQNVDMDTRPKGPDELALRTISEDITGDEKHVEKILADVLTRFGIWNSWLTAQKGVGTIAASWLLAEFDIEIATTVSKMWQFAGLNPSMRRGQKAIKKKEYKKDMGKVLGDLPPAKDGSARVRVLTDTMVRADKKTEGFLCPFNAKLRTALVGVLADGFIKAKAPYALEFYYPYKKRLENSEREVDGKKWSEVSKGRRDRAAKRYMIKMFLVDFYKAWRLCEGLPVREPYSEEYLGKTHGYLPPREAA